MKRIGLFSFISIFVMLLGSNITAAEKKINFQADNIEYLTDESQLRAKGNVNITHGVIKLTAQSALLDLLAKKVYAQGDVCLTEGDSDIYAQEVIYHFDSSTGTLKKTDFNFAPWHMNNESLVKLGEKKFVSPFANLTTCELPLPHYRLATRKVELVLDEKLVTYHSVLFVGPVPVFYFPIYYRSLKERKLHILTYPGYGTAEGLFVRNRIEYSFNPYMLGKIYLDYFTIKGLGLGAEYDYYYRDRIKGSVYGYGIEEKDTLVRRGSGHVKHWQDLTKGWIVTADMNLSSDESVSNQYFRDEWYRVNRQLTSSLAITKSAPNYTLRILTDRTDSWKLQENRFNADVVTNPQITFTTQQLRIGKSPFYYSLNTEVSNKSVKDSAYYLAQGLSADLTTYYLTSGNLQTTLSAGFAPIRDWTIMPQVSVQEYGQNRTNANDKSDLYRGFLNTNINSRTYFTRWLSLDCAHSYRTQIEVSTNTLVNQVLFNLWLQPASVLELYSNSGYDILKQTWHQLRTELRGRVWDSFRWSILENHEVKENRMLSLQTEVSAGDIDKQYFSTGITFIPEILNIASANLNWRLQSNFSLFKSWYFNIGLRENFVINNKPMTTLEVWDNMEKELKLVKDLHCWMSTFLLRQRGLNIEFWFSLNLKLQSPVAKAYPAEQQKEWYPWR